MPPKGSRLKSRARAATKPVAPVRKPRPAVLAADTAIAAQIDAYCEWLCVHGYSPLTATSRRRLLRAFAAWLVIRSIRDAVIAQAPLLERRRSPSLPSASRAPPFLAVLARNLGRVMTILGAQALMNQLAEV